MSSLPLLVVVKHAIRRVNASFYLLVRVVHKCLDQSFSVARSMLHHLNGLIIAKLNRDYFVWQLVCWADYVTEVDM